MVDFRNCSSGDATQMVRDLFSTFFKRLNISDTKDCTNFLGMVFHLVSFKDVFFDLAESCRVIAFRVIPNSVVTRPVSAVWVPFVEKPFGSLPRWTKLTMGWLALLAIVFGSAFGFALGPVST
jgi:hypothetical protein